VSDPVQENKKTRKEHALPYALRIPRRLLRVKLFDVLHPKAEKVRKLREEPISTLLCSAAGSLLNEWKEDANLCRSINLRLPNILSLSEDGGSHQRIPVLFADEIRGFEKDGGSVAPWHSFPHFPGGKCALNCPCDGCFVRFVIRAYMPRMVRGDQLLGELACLDLW
jgi:hypothetical protein